MELYFVTKLDLKTNHIDLLTHTLSDREALELVKECADKFMTEETRKICDQTGSKTNQDNQNNLTEFVLKDCPDKVNTIEVIRYDLIKTKGMMGISTYYEKKIEKIAQFSYSRYDKEMYCDGCGVLASVELVSDLSSLSTPLQNYQGGYSPLDRQLLIELKSNPLFQNRKIIVENNEKKENIENLELE